MSPTVSFIVPVGNRHYTLRERVTAIAEVLAELASQFSIVVVDFGCDHDTREVALELMREFPQVEFIERANGGQLYEAIEAGIFHSDGDIVFVHDPSLPFTASALHRLWAMRDDDDLVMAQSRPSDANPSLSASFAVNLGESRNGSSPIQMIRRCAIADLLRERANAVPVDKITRTDLSDEGFPAQRLPKLLSRLQRLANAPPHSTHRPPIAS